MKTVIKIMWFATGEPTPHDGRWLKSFDVEANNGRGELITVADPNEARIFDSEKYEQVMDLWMAVPKCHPVRETDGKPNRPLSAYTITVQPLEAAIEEYDAEMAKWEAL